MHASPVSAPVSVTIPVAWGEMDAFQHVNNVVFARWMESARVAYFDRVGLMRRTRAERVGPVLGQVRIDFLRPVTYPDTVRVDVSARAVGRTSFTMAYRVWSTAQGAEVARGEDVVVLFDFDAGRKRPIDEALRDAVAALEGAPPPRPHARGT